MAEPPRTVLISGCSTGIGLELAVQLAQDPRQRFQVVATMRDLGKKGMLEAAAGEALGQTLTVAQLDVCSDESVAQCLSCIQGGEVDVLVNNAGVGLVGPIEGLSLAAMQKVFDTNFFGAVRLVKAVLPGMKKRRQGHIVVVSSVMGLQGVVFNEVYAASKFALEGFFESLAVQLLQFNIFVSLVEPGPVATEFEGKLMEQVSTAEFPGTDPDTLRYFRDSYLPASRELFRNVGQSPQDVVQSSGLRPTGHRQRHRLGQTTPAPTDQRPLLPADRAQSRGPLRRPVCANHPPPALPLAAPPPPWPSMPGLRLPPPPGPAPVSRASPTLPHP
ncbi:retinol dehydrogenase 8 isoform X1 [Equus przewalskii]|uniref:Retinol dehydrogenase 8 isoform X1 n=1 Tax=Equus przewalskii TaxID=9798 RepID=A0ABM4PRJ1_EQUPR